jgi:hypothetical protein
VFRFKEKQCQVRHIRYDVGPVSSLHLRIAGMTFLLLILWGVTVLHTDPRNSPIEQIEIAVEHSSPTAVTLTRTDDGIGITDIRNDGQETVFISIPEEWIRDEVRGATLSAVTATDASLGFKRWSLPPGATVSFRVDITWNGLRIRNISEETMRLAVTTIDLTTKTTETDSYLIDDLTDLDFR